MSKNLNRRKLFFFNIKVFNYLIIIIFLIIVAVYFYLNKTIFTKYLNVSIQNLSEKFNYQYLNLNVNGLAKVDYSFIEDSLNKYNKSSIFLLPLDKINFEIKENNWIKNVNLTTNYKDTLFVEIEEYKPIGIYNFNNKNFYFDINGKIIDQVENNKNNNLDLIIFTGQSSNHEATSIISILEDLNFKKKFKILEMIYINKRRWNIRLKNNKLIALSENFPKKSLENFIEIEKNLSETEMNNIKAFDLRNINKTLLEYY